MDTITLKPRSICRFSLQALLVGEAGYYLGVFEAALHWLRGCPLDE